MTQHELPAPQQLAQLLRQGKRTETTREVTGMFLKRIASALEMHLGELESDVGTRALEDDREIQYLDRAFFVLVPPFSKGNRMPPALTVFLVPGQLWWGVFARGSQDDMRRLQEQLGDLLAAVSEDDTQVSRGDFYREEAIGIGAHLALGESRTPDEVAEAADLVMLAEKIADDLAGWHAQITPHAREIQELLDLAPSQQVWLFQANPKYYSLADDLGTAQIGELDRWSVTRYRDEMKSGDNAVLWQSGKDAGIYALARLMSDPYRRAVEATKQEVEEKPYLEEEWWVDLEYTHILDEPLMREEVKAHPTLRDMQVMRVPMGTNFRVQPGEWEIILELTSGRQREFIPNDVRQIQSLMERFFPDPELRRQCLSRFADSVVHAYQADSDNWGITPYSDKVRLNVGPVVAFSLHKGRIWVALDESSNELRQQLEGLVRWTPEWGFATVPGSESFYVSQEHVADIWSLIEAAHRSFIEQAIKKQARPQVLNAHSQAFVSYLSRLLDRRLPNPGHVKSKNYYKIAPGRDARYWEECLAKDYICVGWDDTGDLTAFENRETFDARFRDLYADRYNEHEPTIQQKADEVWALREIAPGDIIIANQGKSRVLAIGEVVSPGYVWDEERDEFHHTVRVNWDTSFAQEIPTQSIWGFRTVSPVSEELYQRILNRDWDWPLAPVDVVETLKGWLNASGFHFTPWQIATFFTALQTKGFVILSGISGTGKTKLAQHMAQALPQPMFRASAEQSEVITITVQPYMPKYSRFIIPKSAVPLYEPPPEGESKEVLVKYDGAENYCKLAYNVYVSTNYIELYLREEAGQWFRATFKPEDVMIVEPLWEGEEKFIGFHLHTEAHYQAQQGGTVQEGENWHFAAVRPDWRDSKSLLGYYNPLSETYEWTPFLRFLLRARNSYRRGEQLAWFVILDEMNLAHVEYYFADLLSVLESGRDEEGWTKEPLKLAYADEAEGDLPPREIHLPPNLYIVGTVNVDETTHAFSPKVLDRAFTLELTEADFDGYPPAGVARGDAPELSAEVERALLHQFSNDGHFVRIDKASIADFVATHPEVRARLQRLNQQLRPYGLHFGYRVFDEIVTFLDHAEENGIYENVLDKEDVNYGQLSEANLAFDAAVLMKLLPRFHGSRGQLEEPLKEVLAWCVDPDQPDNDNIVGAGDSLEKLRALSYQLPHTAERVRRMLWQLYMTGFAT